MYSNLLILITIHWLPFTIQDNAPSSDHILQVKPFYRPSQTMKEESLAQPVFCMVKTRSRPNVSHAYAMFLMFVQFSLCQATFIILLTASILVTAKQYMGGLHIHQFTKRQRGRQRKRQIQAICWWVRPKYTKREVIWAMPERKHFVSGSGPLEVNTKITLKVPNVQKNIHFCHQFFSRRPN